MCTGISFTTIDQQEFLGRTQEYAIDYDYVLAQFPAHYQIQTAASSWQTAYSVMGVSVLEDNQLASMVLDGINEHGLTASTQYFDENSYASLIEIEAVGKKAVYAEQFIFYLLSMCRDIEDVLNQLNDLAIPDTSLLQSEGLPQHFLVKDLTGRTIVIEPSKKLGFVIFENAVGVMTNAPSFDWHLTHLRQFTGLSSVNQPSLTLNGKEISSFGKGSGLSGLPGDFTASSRFIRAAMLLHFSQPIASDQGFNFGFHLLATSDIPKGIIKVNDSYQYTQYTVFYHQQERQVAIKLYDNLDIQTLQFDPNLTGSEAKVYKLAKTKRYQSLN